MVFDYDKDSKERVPYEYYLERYQKEDPLAISDRTQIPYDEKAGVFTLRLMGCTYQISWPDYQIKAVPENVICHYPLEMQPTPESWCCGIFWRGRRRLLPESSLPTGKCPGAKYISGSFRDGVSSVWLMGSAESWISSKALWNGWVVSE